MSIQNEEQIFAHLSRRYHHKCVRRNEHVLVNLSFKFLDVSKNNKRNKGARVKRSIFFF